jgi:putative addiction module component (TIGR02574 family)
MSDEKIDPEAERLWAEEIARRLTDFDEGRTQAIPWADVRASILSRRSDRR